MAENNLPPEVKDQYEHAAKAMEKKNYPYASELLTQIIRIKPDFARARQMLQLAETKIYDSNPPNLIKRLLTAIISQVSAASAIIKETKRDYSQAIVMYEDILKKDPKNVAVLIKLGNLLKVEGMREAAAVMLESAVSFSDKRPIAYELLGEIYSDIGNYDRARYCFKKVLAMKPVDHNAERGLKNLDALTTIDKSFEKKDGDDFRLREIRE